MSTFKEQEELIRLRINRAIYSQPLDVVGAYYAWNDYAILLGRAYHPWETIADQICNGYEMRAKSITFITNNEYVTPAKFRV